jgi:protein SCO1/2
MNNPRHTRRLVLGGLLSLGLGARAAPSRLGTGERGLWELAGLWEDDQERRVTMAEWAGRPALLTMAYGSCRRICSTSLRLLQQAQQEADARGIDLSVIVVSLDPRVDTPAAWRQFRQERALQRPNWHFLEGSPALVQRVAALLEMKYWVYDDHVLHDLRIAAVDAAGRIVARMDWVDEPPRRLIDALAS